MSAPAHLVEQWGISNALRLHARIAWDNVYEAAGTVSACGQYFTLNYFHFYNKYYKVVANSKEMYI